MCQCWQPEPDAYQKLDCYFTKRDATDPAERIARLLEVWSARIARSFLEAIGAIKDEIDLRELEVLIARGQLDRVESRITRAANAVAAVSGEAFVTSARDTSRFLSEALRVNVAFDVSNDRAIGLVRTARLNLIREFTQDQREVVRASVIRQLQQGSSPRQTAQTVRDAIGLTVRQNASVERYRQLLEVGSSQALTRNLRDRRFDGAIRRAIREETPLTPEQIQRQVARYQERFLSLRAQNIGNTEGSRALNQGRHEGYQQYVDQGILSEDQIIRIWNTNRDGRERLTHNVLHRTEVRGLTERYELASGARLLFPTDPSGPADETVNCRCTETIRIIRAEQARLAA